MPHSWYWRSPHWTREEAYFFQFRWHEDLFRRLIANNNLQPTDKPSPNPDYCFDKPAWFTPPSAAGYESWRCDSSADCWLFREAETKEVFFYMCQL